MHNSYRSLLNDFAFKYVFGADTKESNEALKGILEIYLNMNIKQLKIKNPEMTKNIDNMKDIRFDILADLDHRVQVDIEMQVIVDEDELIDRLMYYVSRIHASQNLKGKLYSEAKQSIVLAFIHGKIFENPFFYQKIAMYTEEGYLFSDKMKICLVELKKIDGSKLTKEMTQQEKLAYYFLNCQNIQNNSKMKELIEQDKVIQMIDKRVDQIEEDRWKKLDQDFAEFHENERQMRIKKWQEKYEKELEEKHKQDLEEALDKGLQKGLNQGVIQTIRQLSKTLSIAQIALALEISEEKVKEYLVSNINN